MPLSEEDVIQTLLRIERQGSNLADGMRNLDGRFTDLEGRFDRFQQGVFGSKRPGARATPFSGMAAVRPEDHLNGTESLKKTVTAPRFDVKEAPTEPREREDKSDGDKGPDTPRKPASIVKQTEEHSSEIQSLKSEVSEIKALVQASVKAQGVAAPTPEGEPDPTRLEKLVTFLASERGVSFVIKLATLAGVFYGAFYAATHGAPPGPFPPAQVVTPPALTEHGPSAPPAP